MKQKLIVIFGLPRTGTTYLFKRFQGEGAHGTYQKRDVNADLVTEEPRGIGTIARGRWSPTHTNQPLETMIKQHLEKILEYNKTDAPAIVTKHPMYTGIADIMKRCLDEIGVDTVWINTVRNPLDIIMSMDAQREYTHNLIHNIPRFNDDNFKRMPFFFYGCERVLRFTPELRAVAMVRSMMRYEHVARKSTDPYIFDYDNVPDSIDADLEKLTGINPRIRDNWVQGSGRNHKKTKLDIEMVRQHLEVYL